MGSLRTVAASSNETPSLSGIGFYLFLGPFDVHDVDYIMFLSLRQECGADDHGLNVDEFLQPVVRQFSAHS
jgi:hypothetical protein